MKNSNLVDQISRDTRKAPLFNPSQNAKNEKIGDNGYNWQVVRPRRTRLSMEQKSGTDANRNVVPGEETYSEALRNKQPEHRNTVDNSQFLSTKEFPTLMNSFGILETIATKQLNENEKKHEEINRARSTTAHKRPTTTEILGDSIIKGIQGHKVKEAINHSENVFVRSFAGANTDAMNSYVCPTIKKAPKRSYCIVALTILDRKSPHGSLQKTSWNLQNKWKAEKLRSLYRELFREQTN